MNEYQFKWHVFMVHSVDPVKSPLFTLGIVELCAEIRQIMRNFFQDYARCFCKLCTNYARHFSPSTYGNLNS